MTQRRVRASGYRTPRFDYEGADAGVTIRVDDTEVRVCCYHPLENIGKRGAKVDVLEYRLYAPKGAKKCASELRKRLKPDMPYARVSNTIRTVMQEAEKRSIMDGKGYPSRFYEPSQRSLKGIDPLIPDPSGVDGFQDCTGKDVCIKFRKPEVILFSIKTSREAAKGLGHHFITVKWNNAGKIDGLSAELVKLKGLDEVARVLDENRVKYATHQYKDERYDMTASAETKKQVIATLIKAGRKDLANAYAASQANVRKPTRKQAKAFSAAEKVTKFGKKLGTSEVNPHVSYYSYDGNVIANAPEGLRYLGSTLAFRNGVDSGKYSLAEPKTVPMAADCDNMVLEGSPMFAAEFYSALGKAKDLCQISPPICKGNLGIPRIKMPQLPEKVVRSFIDWWRSRGTKVKVGKTKVGKLHATQKEINQEKVMGMADAMQKGKFDPAKKPIITSKDQYILDGHHRWAALVFDDPNNKIPTINIDAPIKDLLKVADSFEGVEKHGL